MGEYIPTHRADREPDEPISSPGLDALLRSLEYKPLREIYFRLYEQFEQESRSGGDMVQLQMAEVAHAYPGLYELILDMTDTSQEQNRTAREVQALSQGIELGAVTMLSILKYHIEVEELTNLYNS